MKRIVPKVGSNNPEDGDASRVEMRFDPSLAEAAVLREMGRREERGDPSLARTYRRLSDPLYDLESEEEREKGFARLHLQLCAQLGFPKQVSDALAEFPRLTRKVQRIFVARAFSRADEGADLSQDAKSIGVSVLAERFLDAQRLRAFLRHELMHVADMLDEAFDYRRDEAIIAHSPAQRNVIRDRYRILWDITIDGRLTRARKETVADRKERDREFSALFANLPEPQRQQIFERLWRAEGVTHGELLGMAQGFQGLRAEGLGGTVGSPEVEGGAGDVQPLSVNPQPLVGSSCPLCKFPTYEWAQGLEEAIVNAVKQDFPQWQPEQSVCERCAELYRLRAGRW